MPSPVGVKLVWLWPVLWVVVEVVDGDMYDKAFGEGESLHSDVLRALTAGSADVHALHQKKKGALECIKEDCTSVLYAVRGDNCYRAGCCDNTPRQLWFTLLQNTISFYHYTLVLITPCCHCSFVAGHNIHSYYT